MSPLCPECGTRAGDPLERRSGERGGVVWIFECSDCTHVWEIGV